jgi:hypothetical protein
MRAYEQVRKDHGFLYAVLGKTWKDANPKFPVKFERLEKITGDKIEIRLLGKLETMTTVADGADECADDAGTYTNNNFGNVTFDLAHYAGKKVIPSSEYNRIKGREAKTLSYIDEVHNLIMLSQEKEMATQMAGANAPSRTQLGGWQYAVSSGVTADGEAANASYGGLDRSDDGNIDYRSYVKQSSNLDWKVIRYVKNKVKLNGGSNKLGLAGLAPYTTLQDMAQAYTVIENDTDWLSFGGEYFQYGNTRYILDGDSPDSVMGFIDPESWAFWQNDLPFTEEGIIRSQTKKAAYLLPWEFWVQLICRQPARNGKITGITVSI